MMSRRALGRSVLGLLAGGGAAALLGGCSSGESSYRFRMTVEVATPEGLKRGSSVMEIVAYKELFVTGDRGGGHSGLGGEAVVVDLANGPLFVLLTIRDGGPKLHSVVTNALAPTATSGGFDSYLSAVDGLGGMFSGTTTAELPREDWPMMVRFRDLSDPTSVERVDPASIGVKRVVLETTGDDMTTGIEEKIPWLPNVYKLGIGPEFRPKGIPLGDFKGLFSTEIGK